MVGGVHIVCLRANRIIDHSCRDQIFYLLRTVSSKTNKILAILALSSSVLYLRKIIEEEKGQKY